VSEVDENNNDELNQQAVLQREILYKRRNTIEQRVKFKSPKKDQETRH